MQKKNHKLETNAIKLQLIHLCLFIAKILAPKLKKDAKQNMRGKERGERERGRGALTRSLQEWNWRWHHGSHSQEHKDPALNG